MLKRRPNQDILEVFFSKIVNIHILNVLVTLTLCFAEYFMNFVYLSYDKCLWMYVRVWKICPCTCHKVIWGGGGVEGTAPLIPNFNNTRR
jgi:hypothetical protein